jgi:hypothetical protein
MSACRGYQRSSFMSSTTALLVPVDADVGRHAVEHGHLEGILQLGDPTALELLGINGRRAVPNAFQYGIRPAL